MNRTWMYLVALGLVGVSTPARAQEAPEPGEDWTNPEAPETPPAAEGDAREAPAAPEPAPPEPEGDGSDGAGSESPPSDRPDTEGKPPEDETPRGTESGVPQESEPSGAVAAEPAPSKTPVSERDAPATAATGEATREGKSVSTTTAAAETRGAGPADLAVVGLDPGAPQVPTLPGGVTPAFGSPTGVSEDFQLVVHGFVSVPLRLGINQRRNAGSRQQQMVLHAPPQVPGEFESFGYTAVVPDPWVQLNFIYGNPYVSATVIVASRTVTNAVSYFDAQDMIGINDAFLTFRAPVSDELALSANVGAFANRYGQMGEYDLGRYGTPLIARIGGVGATGTGRLRQGSVDVAAEVGFHGQLTKTPVNVEPAGWNGFADPNVGSTFAAHGHLVVGVDDFVHFGGHAISALVRDDRVAPDQPRGDLRILGGDVRMTGGRLGHLYAGFAHTAADQARGISGVVRVLNAPGGPGLMRNYFGPNSEGTGELFTFGAEYTLSLGTLLRYPAEFEGNGPDLLASVFGVATRVESPNDPEYDDVQKVKYGTELTYSMLRWLAVGGRYDRVLPDIDDSTQTHAIASLRTIFRSNWNSRDQVVLQYSHFFTGSGSVVVDGYPPGPDPTIEPDAHVVSLAATMWW